MTPPEVLHHAELETPVGRIVALASARGLAFLEYDNPERRRRLDDRLRRWFQPYTIVDEPSALLSMTRAWLKAYFAGRASAGGPTPLDLRGTEFEQRVWSCLLQIPPGTTFTYGAIAERLGDAQKARAVGAAVGANPVSLIVPCHRMIGSDGSLTGYGGGLDVKRWLLKHEAQWSEPIDDKLF
ncbi:MAG: methylated-DNA--[protein]-cysteine S-methyltransferase [Vicinamibacterales bacterium]